jgi:hypothetical protein
LNVITAMLFAIVAGNAALPLPVAAAGASMMNAQQYG